MKKRLKNLTSVFIAVVMVMSMVSVGIVSASAITRDEVVLKLDSFIQQYE